MKFKELEIFKDMPFLFWVKDRQGRYLRGNRQINQLVREDITGKTDRELIWSENADALQAGDKAVFETGKPNYLHEYVDKSSHGKTALSVCKWLDELEGETHCFGISFFIE